MANFVLVKKSKHLFKYRVIKLSKLQCLYIYICITVVWKQVIDHHINHEVNLLMYNLNWSVKPSKPYSSIISNFINIVDKLIPGRGRSTTNGCPLVNAIHSCVWKKTHNVVKTILILLFDSFCWHVRRISCYLYFVYFTFCIYNEYQSINEHGANLENVTARC